MATRAILRYIAHTDVIPIGVGCQLARGAGLLYDESPDGKRFSPQRMADPPINMAGKNLSPKILYSGYFFIEATTYGAIAKCSRNKHP
jgi:hypothetical protein